jgi:hypothetical protein
MALGVLGKEFARGIEMSVLADTGENVEDLPAIRARILDAVRGDNREPMLFPQIAELLVHTFFAAQKMALDFDPDIVPTKNIDQMLRVITLRSSGCSRRT